MKYNHHNLDFEVYVRLHDLQKILSKYQPDGEFDEEMSRHLELIRTKKYRVAVLGEFSRGKSSLINALLGSSILPADVLPSTATINRVTFGLDPHVEIVYKDGKSEKIAIDAMENYVTKLTEKSQEKAATIEEAVVVYPTVICQNYIDIIDTPGLNESEDMTFLTKSQLNKIDAAIVTISALSPLSETERTLIRSLIESEEICYLIFAVSFIDRIDEEDVERVLADICNRISQMGDTIAESHGEDSDVAKKAYRILKQPELYGISAKKALKAFETNNNKLLKESCFPEFQKALYRILTTQQNINAIDKSLRMMLGMRERLETWYQRERTKLEKNIERVQEISIAMEAFLGEETMLLKHIVRQKLLAIDEKKVLTYLCETYRKACVNELAQILVDEEENITQGILNGEKKINEITKGYIEMYLADLKRLVSEALNLFDEQYREKICAYMDEADIEYGKTLRGRLEKIRNEVNELQGSSLDLFVYKNQMTINIRHSNPIAGLNKSGAEYAKVVISHMKQTYEMAFSIGMKLAGIDVEHMQEMMAVYKEFVHNVLTDKMLYERQYVKHQDELEEIFDFCKELEAEILH